MARADRRLLQLPSTAHAHPLLSQHRLVSAPVPSPPPEYSNPTQAAHHQWTSQGPQPRAPSTATAVHTAHIPCSGFRAAGRRRALAPAAPPALAANLQDILPGLSNLPCSRVCPRKPGSISAQATVPQIPVPAPQQLPQQQRLLPQGAEISSPQVRSTKVPGQRAAGPATKDLSRGHFPTPARPRGLLEGLQLLRCTGQSQRGSPQTLPFALIRIKGRFPQFQPLLQPWHRETGAMCVTVTFLFRPRGTTHGSSRASSQPFHTRLMPRMLSQCQPCSQRGTNAGTNAAGWRLGR